MTEAEAKGFQMRKQFYFAYHSLVLYSFGLENALERSKMDISFFLTNVHESATVSEGGCSAKEGYADEDIEMLHDRQGPLPAVRVSEIPA